MILVTRFDNLETFSSRGNPFGHGATNVLSARDAVHSYHACAFSASFRSIGIRFRFRIGFAETTHAVVFFWGFLPRSFASLVSVGARACLGPLALLTRARANRSIDKD
jgi:hypothetical protein